MSRIGKLPIEIPKGATVECGRPDRYGQGLEGDLSITLSELVRRASKTGQFA